MRPVPLELEDPDQNGKWEARKYQRCGTLACIYNAATVLGTAGQFTARLLPQLKSRGIAAATLCAVHAEWEPPSIGILWVFLSVSRGVRSPTLTVWVLRLVPQRV